MTTRMSAEQFRKQHAVDVKPLRPKGLEAGLQFDIKQALHAQGYLSPATHVALGNNFHAYYGIVFDTSQRRASEVDKGTPDLFVKPKGQAFLIGIEVKRPDGKGRVSAEQAWCAGACAYAIVTSVEDALAFVRRWERAVVKFG